jgi:hypothetical protein
MERLALLYVVLSLLGQATPSFARGALALGSCDADGYSFGHYTGGLPMRQAEQQALAFCPGGGCTIILTIPDFSCMALAIESPPPCGAVGWGSGGTKAQAAKLAINACVRYGGRNCRIAFARCDEAKIVPSVPGTGGVILNPDPCSPNKILPLRPEERRAHGCP